MGNFFERGKVWANKRAATMKSKTVPDKRGAFSADGISTLLLKVSSEMIRVYLVFLRFSNYLLRLIQ